MILHNWKIPEKDAERKDFEYNTASKGQWHFISDQTEVFLVRKSLVIKLNLEYNVACIKLHFLSQKFNF